MKLSQLEQALEGLDTVTFQLPNNDIIPPHFHVTEVGKVDKHFIDCGGTVRKETVVNFQLWTADDYDHRLSVKKLKSIIALSKDTLGLPDAEIEVEYQGDTIGKYGLDLKEEHLQLTQKQTDCLAKDNCGIPTQKPKIRLKVGQAAEQCAPGSGCC